MKTLLVPLLATLAGLVRSREVLHLEILALRQQLAMVTERDRKRLRFRRRERLFWVWLYRLWPGCLQTLNVFKPDTLVRWHRKGFRLYWYWKSSRRAGGRPGIDPEVCNLIRTMSRDNICWGAPRIHGELQMLGIRVSQATKRIIKPMLGFKFVGCAAAILAGIELVHMIRKGQPKQRFSQGTCAQQFEAAIA